MEKRLKNGLKFFFSFFSKSGFRGDVFQRFPNFFVIFNARKLGLVLKCSWNSDLQMYRARFLIFFENGQQISTVQGHYVMFYPHLVRDDF